MTTRPVGVGQLPSSISGNDINFTGISGNGLFPHTTSSFIHNITKAENKPVTAIVRGTDRKKITRITVADIDTWVDTDTYVLRDDSGVDTYTTLKLAVTGAAENTLIVMTPNDTLGNRFNFVTGSIAVAQSALRIETDVIGTKNIFMSPSTNSLILFEFPGGGTGGHLWSDIISLGGFGLALLDNDSGTSRITRCLSFAARREPLKMQGLGTGIIDNCFVLRSPSHGIILTGANAQMNCYHNFVLGCGLAAIAESGSGSASVDIQNNVMYFNQDLNYLVSAGTYTGGNNAVDSRNTASLPGAGNVTNLTPANSDLVHYNAPDFNASRFLFDFRNMDLGGVLQDAGVKVAGIDFDHDGYEIPAITPNMGPTQNLITLGAAPVEIKDVDVTLEIEVAVP